MQVSHFYLLADKNEGNGMMALIQRIGIVLGLVVSMFAQAATENLPEVSARFETVQCANPCKKSVEKNWWLMRTPKTLELRQVKNKAGKLAMQGEMWKYQPNGKTSYLFLMHDDKRAIEYLFDDLRILGLGVDDHQWELSSQFIADDELAALKKSNKASKDYQGYTTEIYNGVIGEADVSMVWLPALKLPVTLEYRYPTSKTTIKLKALVAGDDLRKKSAASPKTVAPKLASYDHIYYTDIGDMEEDPTAQAWIAHAAGAPGMHAHNH